MFKTGHIKVGIVGKEFRPDEVLAAGFLKAFESFIMEQMFDRDVDDENIKFKFIVSPNKNKLKKCNIILDFKDLLSGISDMDINCKYIFSDIKSFSNFLYEEILKEYQHPYLSKLIELVDKNVNCKKRCQDDVYTSLINKLNDCSECGRKKVFKLAVKYTANLIVNIKYEEFKLLNSTLDDYIKLSLVEEKKLRILKILKYC